MVATYYFDCTTTYSRPIQNGEYVSNGPSIEYTPTGGKKGIYRFITVNTNKFFQNLRQNLYLEYNVSEGTYNVINMTNENPDGNFYLVLLYKDISNGPSSPGTVITPIYRFNYENAKFDTNLVVFNPTIDIVIADLIPYVQANGIYISDLVFSYISKTNVYTSQKVIR
jgi:hypothetical protein